MSMNSKFFLMYAAVLGTILVVDALWLGVIAKSLYREKIGHLMSSEVAWWAAIVFYALYAFGLVMLVVQPGSSVGQVFAFGALFGLVAYGTYDLTNQAVMRDWPVSLTIIDMAWGSFITALASLAGFLVRK